MAGATAMAGLITFDSARGVLAAASPTGLRRSAVPISTARAIKLIERGRVEQRQARELDDRTLAGWRTGGYPDWSRQW
jgi:hypothetical protein